MRALATTVLVATAIFGVTGCQDTSGCGYNGNCTSGRCVCNHPWKGPECQVLDLAQVPKQAGYHLPATSSWGGSVLQDETGKLWMYAAEMVGHCGIGSWTRNSRVILASSESISSPFKFEKELFGVFSHEPFATRGPKGEYVLYFTTTTLGCGAYGPCVPADTCAGMGNGTTCNPGGPACWNNCSNGATCQGCFDHASERSPRTRFPTYMTYASHPLGPYSEPVMVYNGSDQAGLNAPATGDTNMAGVIFPDGSLFGMWRGDRKQLNHSRPVYQYQYAVNASDWKDPSTYQWGYALKAYNIFPGLIHGPQDHTNCGIEDPHLWLDENEIVHAVVHNWKAGGHAVSADKGKTWQWFGGNCSYSAGPDSVDWTRSVWPATFTYNGNTQRVSPHRRERPHIVVDNRGQIVALTNGIQTVGPDVTWTMVNPVVQATE